MSLVHTARTLADIPPAHAAASPGRTALVFEDRVTTFAEFDAGVRRAAGGLTRLGVKAGDRIAYLGKNTDRYFELLFAAAALGVVMTPVSWRLAAPEVEWILNDCEARVVFVTPDCAALATAAGGERRVISVEGSDWPGWMAQASDPAEHAPAPHDVVLQLYTSGTTGRPKGALITHDNLLAPRRAQADLAWNKWSDEDVSLLSMPLFHIGGTGWGVSGLVNGAASVIVAEFNPADVLGYIETFGISKLFMVPAALQIVARHPRARSVDYSRLKTILYGASPIPLDLLKECMEVFGCGFAQMYGMTETAGTIVALPPADHRPEGHPRMRAAGLPLPGVELRIVDQEGADLPPMQVGEIMTRSAANMAGYWKRPADTAATIDGDGWLRTGDAGYLDEDGYLYIHDRVKDLIISGGENIYPAEVENALFGHPAVADVCVIGVPSERWGEAVKAFVVPRQGESPDPAELIAWAAQRIAPFKAPKSIDFVEALPRNASGKLLRRELREPYWRDRDRQIA